MMRLALIAALALASSWAHAGLFGAEQLLEPDQAFRLSARALDSRAIEVRFAIAEGYYMYRDRFRFATSSGQALAADLPRGEMKDDPFFGRTEILRREARVRLSVPSSAAGTLTLDVTSQGCADRGVCYLPQTQRLTVELPRR